MKLIVWGGLLAVTFLADLAATTNCSPSRIESNNVALGKPTFQSSTYPNVYGGPSEKAVDGDCNGVWTHGSCTHTNLELNPWWLVDLGKTERVYTVLLKNREDCCAERLNGVEVRLGDSLEDHGRLNQLCEILRDFNPGLVITFYCSGLQGRYLSVHLPRSDYLTLCEVEAYKDR